MISNKRELVEYMDADRKALGISYKHPRFLRDEIYRFEILLRKAEYANNCCHGPLSKLRKFYTRYRLHRMGTRLGFTIPINTFGKGLSIAHIGCIVVNGNASIGEYCRIQESVTIGATNGSKKAPILGDRCFLGSGARIIGEITIANDVAIGANAVVVHSIEKPGTTWGGIPSKQISNHSSKSNLVI